MKIEEFIKNAVEQIRSGCEKSGVQVPEKVEFHIQLNDQGEVCTQGQMPVSSIKMVV